MTLLIKQRAFTLIEIAIVLVIIGFLLALFLSPLSVHIDQKNYAETKQKVELIKESLLGYVVVNSRLPCPDNNGDGLEETIVGVVNSAGQSIQSFTCTNLEGRLPFLTLGAERLDSWSNHFSYRVAPQFSTRTIEWSGLNATGTVLSDTTFNLTSLGNIAVETRGDNPSTAGVQEAKFINNFVTNAVVLIRSHGKNGYGALNISGALLPAPPATNIDENQNNNIGTVKRMRLIANLTAGCSDILEGFAFCEFDDYIDWLPANLVFNRMVTTDQLP